jgi:hypothetical protein
MRTVTLTEADAKLLDAMLENRQRDYEEVARWAEEVRVDLKHARLCTAKANHAASIRMKIEAANPGRKGPIGPE